MMKNWVLRLFFPAFWAVFVFAASTWIALRFSSSQFGGYDLSPLIDLSWRINAGEVPGVDFLNTMPPVMIVILKFASVLPLDWRSLVAVNGLFLAVTWTVVFFFTRRLFLGWVFDFSIPLLLSFPLLYTNHLWHSTASQALAVMCCSMVVGARFSGGWNGVAIILVCGIFISLAKQNVALPMLLLGSVGLMQSGGRFGAVGAASLLSGFLIGFFIYAYLFDIPAAALHYSLTAAKGRALPQIELLRVIFSQQFQVALLVCVVIVFYLVVTDESRHVWNFRYLRLMFFASLIPFLTDWDDKINSLVFPVFLMVLAASLAVKEQRISVEGRMVRVVIVSAFVVLLTLFCYQGGQARNRMRGVGDFYDPDAVRSVSDGYFRGLVVGDELHGVLDEMNDAMADFSPSSVFFGPRIEFGYCVTGSRSPRGMPLWWHPGTSYAVEDAALIASRFQKNEFDLLVFRKGDRTRMPAEVLAVISEDFEAAPGFDYLDIFRRRRKNP